MKKEYEKPEIEIIKFEIEDITCNLSSPSLADYYLQDGL